VREFVIQNALHWAHEYHVDGLRLDATHAIVDDSPCTCSQEMAARVRESLPPGRRFLVIAEDERNERTLVLPRGGGRPTGWTPCGRTTSTTSCGA
jgi:maltooligosyltrehalose trehalohydrolase